MRLKTFTPSDVAGKKVLVRVDFNVPMQDGQVTDVTRLESHIPTIKALMDMGARVSLLSHFGRPKGVADPKCSLKPVGEKFAEISGFKVRFVRDCTGPLVEDAVAAQIDEILMLENVRFHADESKNSPEFARKLAAPFCAYVMDAFSVAHRAHTSTRALTEILPSFAGHLMAKEITMLSAPCEKPEKPYVLILGGSKVSDKIGVVENMLDKTDYVLVGGGMAFTFMKALGYEIGRSLCETEKLGFAAEMLRKAEKLGVKIVLPKDFIFADEFRADSPYITVDADNMPANKIGLDIGPKTVAEFTEIIHNAKTVLWNGPMGVFEMPAFAEGTRLVAKAIAEATEKGALTIAGGGDSAAAATLFGFAKQVSHVSTGGGASLEFFEGKMLPGIEPYIIKE